MASEQRGFHNLDADDGKTEAVAVVVAIVVMLLTVVLLGDVAAVISSPLLSTHAVRLFSDSGKHSNEATQGVTLVSLRHAQPSWPGGQLTAAGTQNPSVHVVPASHALVGVVRQRQPAGPRQAVGRGVGAGLGDSLHGHSRMPLALDLRAAHVTALAQTPPSAYEQKPLESVERP
jgi:hypothetical protein